MSKRAAENEEERSGALKAGVRPMSDAPPDEVGEFEDEFEDEFESEDEIVEAGVDGRPDAEREAEEKDEMEVDRQTFIPGRTKLGPEEILTPDTSTYDMLHNLSTPWPCLSFDIVRDNLGDNRKTYPATVYAVAGTQADSSKRKDNELMVLKLSGLSKIEREDEDSDGDDEDEDEDAAEPILESKSIPLHSTTNRIRAHQTPHSSGDSSRPPQTVTASMLENSQVVIHDVSPHLASFDNPGLVLPPSASKPLSTLRMHKSEGYALDWSPLNPLGKLLTGDNDGLIYVTSRTEAGEWVTDSRPFTAHTSSVEEIQWSPNERNVFASASSDGSVKVWDVRSKSRKPALDVKVSNTDVNVMSWNRQTFHLLATGADDGQWGVFDLRQWKPQDSSSSSSGSGQLKPSPVASFDFHKEPITSIEWHPNDDSVVAVAAADNTVTLWDLAVEMDDEEAQDAGMADVPSQLLFVHYMEQAKELHWQVQMPGTVMATGNNGFGHPYKLLLLADYKKQCTSGRNSATMRPGLGPGLVRSHPRDCSRYRRRRLRRLGFQIGATAAMNPIRRQHRQVGLSVHVRWDRCRRRAKPRKVRYARLARKRLSLRRFRKIAVIIRMDCPCESEHEPAAAAAAAAATETETETESESESESKSDHQSELGSCTLDSHSDSDSSALALLATETHADKDESRIPTAHSRTPETERSHNSSSSPSEGPSPHPGEGEGVDVGDDQQPVHLHLRGGCGLFDKETYGTLGDDDRVPRRIWFLAGARPGHPPPTGKQLREWKEKSKGKWPEGQKRGFFAEVVFVLSHGRHCRHHPKYKPRNNQGEEGGCGSNSAAGGG